MFENDLENELLKPDPWTFVHVCAFDQALKLKSFGLYQKSYMNWYYYTNSMKKGIEISKYTSKRYRKLLEKYGDDNLMEIVSAYNVCELGLMLPNGYFSLYDESLCGWICLNQTDSVNQISNFSFETEAKARADKLINLIVNEVVSVVTINDKYLNSIDELKSLNNTDE
jgi:hypothetical protein